MSEGARFRRWWWGEPPSHHERLEEIKPTAVAIEAEAGRFHSWGGGHAGGWQWPDAVQASVVSGRGKP